MSGTPQGPLHKRAIEFVIMVAALLIFLAAMGFGVSNLGLRLAFVVWGVFLIIVAVSSWHLWNRGIFKQKTRNRNSFLHSPKQLNDTSLTSVYINSSKIYMST